MGSFRIGRFLVSFMYGYKGKDISKVVDGVKYKTPILLSAGFDYNANLIDILSSMSFGGVEVGSVTARPCLGNSTPRLRRLINTKSIMVNKGLRNDGVDKIINKIKNKKTSDLVIGISVARTNDKNTATVESGIEDYIYSLKKVVASSVGDYYTINISCPNAFGGEAFTTPILLEQLFSSIDKVERTKPLYVKMPISIADETFFELLEVLDRHKVNGVIIGNLQKDYSQINPKDKTPEKYSGGLSGKPCEDRSNFLIKKTKEKFKNRFTIVGCGGVFSYEDAKKKFDAGADLIHLITGMIFEGPSLIKNICEGIAKEK
ncbi:MAG: dihydroorotate dehydrogenase [Patescibacteria group bacterium]|nr:dihydroorotate dehydrogenase [Patescibacteria group bacterium]